MRSRENENKSRLLARVLFPNEEWVKTEDNIFVAKGRLVERQKEPEKWEKEMSQARILTRRGSVAFFLPEYATGKKERRCADLVLDGSIMEMKIIDGTRETLGTQFRYGFKQGAALASICPFPAEHSVFIWLLSDLSVDSVRAKVAGELKGRADNGAFKCYFESINQLHSWNYAELRSIIGKK